ncbi:MAG: hypothetical protein QXN52_09835 [Nitrososphaerota archaeon]
MLLKIGKIVNIDIVKNYRKASFEIEPFDKENFLYFTARAVSSYETDGFNENGDAFLWDELKKAYKTFVGRNLFLDHQTHPLNTVGKVIDAYPVDEPNTKYIECLCKVDRKSFPQLVRNIETGILNTVSMGASVDRSICSVCGYYITSDNDPRCEHMLNLFKEFPSMWDFPKANIKKGQLIKAFYFNEGIRFTELSLVTNPADKKALVRSVFSHIRPNVSFERRNKLVHSNWKVIYPNKVFLSIPIYSIGKEGALSYYVSSKFGNDLIKLSNSMNSREIISYLKIGGDFMKEIEEKIKKLLSREQLEMKEGEKSEIKELKKVLSLLKNPEKNYDEIVSILEKFLEEEKEEMQWEKEDVSLIKEILKKFKEFFGKDDNELEEEEEEEETKEVDIMEEEDMEEVSEEKDEEEETSKIVEEVKKKSFFHLNNNDLFPLFKKATLKEEKEISKPKEGPSIKEEKEISKPKEGPSIKEEKEISKPKEGPSIKEEKEISEKLKIDFKEILDVLNMTDFPTKFELVGKLGEVKGGPLGEIAKLLVRDSEGETYEIYFKIMKSGEKISVPSKEVSFEEKKSFVFEKLNIHGINDSLVETIYDSYVDVFTKGDFFFSIQPLVNELVKLANEVNNLKIESKIKEKMSKCSFIVDKKILSGELIPDIEEINKLASKNISFIEARRQVLEKMRKEEVKKLMAYSDEKIDILYKTYMSLSNDKPLTLGNITDSSLLNGIDSDDEFLKKLPWS